MANVLIDGAVIRLTAAATWGWLASAPATPTFANFVDVVLVGSGSPFTKGGTVVVIQPDIASSVSSYTDTYHIAGAPAVGGGLWLNVAPLSTGADGTLLGVTIADAIGSAITTKGGVGVMLDDATGAFTVAVTVPALSPTIPPITPDTTGAPPVPSAVLVLAGTWAIQDHGQGTVLITSA